VHKACEPQEPIEPWLLIGGTNTVRSTEEGKETKGTNCLKSLESGLSGRIPSLIADGKGSFDLGCFLNRLCRIFWISAIIQ
jgi:hypothetical protein